MSGEIMQYIYYLHGFSRQIENVCPSKKKEK